VAVSRDGELTFLEARERALEFHRDVATEVPLLADVVVPEEVAVVRRGDRWIARVRLEVDLGAVTRPPA
jgi:hypothetical protein